MYITFKKKKLQKEFEDQKALLRARGDRQGRLIMQRMFELESVSKLEEIRFLPGPRCHELVGNRKGQFSVDLNHPYRLIFVPDHEPIPQKESGGIDWGRVTSIKILEITDTHE